MTLEAEIYRALRPSINRSAKVTADGAVSLATDVGLRREENQDRVASLRWTTNDQRQISCLAIIVCDGMGGMKDGGECATLAAAAFLSALVGKPSTTSQLDVVEAAAHANDRVFRSYSGHGGSTLTALLITSDRQVVGVNVGDSRAYALSNLQQPSELERLTTDDTLNEVLGRGDNGLIQYIGMGPGIKPHTFAALKSNPGIILTSDGAHYVPADILSELALRAPDPKSRADRLLAFARWMGGHDNISVASIDLERVLDWLPAETAKPIQLTVPNSELSFVLVAEVMKSHQDLTPKKSLPDRGNGSRSRGKRQRKEPAKHTDLKSDQLQIDIQLSADSDNGE